MPILVLETETSKRLIVSLMNRRIAREPYLLRDESTRKPRSIRCLQTKNWVRKVIALAIKAGIYF